MVPIWLDVLDETARLCAAQGRSDLIQLVRQKRAQLLDPQLRVLVIGEPKQGKSQLVNALINAPVCPVGDGPTTVVPTVITHAEAPCAALVRTSPPTPGRAAELGSDPADRTPIPMDQVAAGVSGKLVSRPDTATVHIEIGVPRGLLASGIVIIDTPGVDAQDPAGMNTLFTLARADVVVMVSDATRELSVSELNLLLHLGQSNANVVVALTKTDMSPHWRVVAEQNRQHLASVGMPAALIPVSAALRLQAAHANDTQINAESGFPLLLTRLKHDQSTKGDMLARTSVSLIARTVIEQLAAPMRAELSIRDSPATTGSLSRLHDAQRAVDELRRCSARWQNTLNDEMTDLISDLEYDLRDRTRKILRQVDETFDTADPLTRWDTFSEWLEENLIEAAAANYEWMLQRYDWITKRVAENFVMYGGEVLPSWSARMPDDLAERVPVLDKPQIDRFTTTQKVFNGLRGSYGGVLMFGLATSLSGLPLINPISLGAGALFGGKTLMDESKSLLKRRQAVVKAAAQRHVDDFFLRFNKDCRDAARQLHRRLRDHFTALTEELQETIVQSFRSAKQAADAEAAERDQRQRQIEQKMKRLAAVYEEAQALVTRRGSTARAGLGSGI